VKPGEGTKSKVTLIPIDPKQLMALHERVSKNYVVRWEVLNKFFAEVIAQNNDPGLLLVLADLFKALDDSATPVSNLFKTSGNAMDR